jgi:hypothetical protein
VVAYNSLDTGYDPSALGIPVNFSNKAAVAAGHPTPNRCRSLPLFGSDLAGLGFLRRRFFSV